MSKFTRLALMYLLAALFLIISNKSFAQDPTSESQLKQEAAKYFDQEDYASAYPLYSQLLSLYPEDPTYNYRTGACMLFTKADKEKPIDYLELAIKKPKVDNIAYFYLGRAYHLNYKFDAAIRTYQRFQKMASSSELKKYPVAHLIDQCNDAKTLLKNMHELDVLDKKQLNYADYFQAYDLSVNGGSVLVEPDDFKTKLDKKKDATSIIYLSADKNKVFFSSYGDDDKNGKDIYEVKRLPTGGFSKPVNLGTIINSPYDEDFPFYDEPTKTLYFSSKGHNSMGGYDVFKSSYNEITDTWSSPVNMDFPINTPDDDILFIADTLNQTAFFASTRFSPKGSIDIYKIKLQPHAPEYVLMRGTTYGDDGKNVAVSTITVKNFKNDQIVGVYNSSPDNGGYLMSLPNAGKFVYTVETNGHKTQSEPVIIPLETGMVTLKQQITYEPETDKLIIKNDFESSGSDSDYLLALNYIKQKAQMEVHIDSNANNQATNNTSQPLANNSNSSTQNNNSANPNASNNSTEANNTSANSTQPNNSSNTNSNPANSNNSSTNNATNSTANNTTNPDNSNVAANNNPDTSNTSNGNVSTAELVKIASNDAKQDQEMAKSMKEDATKATEYANDKLQQAQELQQQAQEISDNSNNITDPAQKKDSLAKADALKKESQELSKKAIEAYELAAQEQNQARDKQQQADQASNYSSQLDSAQKVSNKKQALAQLQAQHDKLLQQQQQKQASPPVATTPTQLILQQAEATKQDSTEIAHHTEDLKKEVPTLQQQSQDYIAQAQKTENPQEKLALLQQAKDLSESKKQKEKEIKESAKLEQQLHNQYVGQVAEAHSADSISKAAPQEVTSPQVAANDVDLKKEIANYNPQANNNPTAVNNNTSTQPNNNSVAANNAANQNNPTTSSTENPTNNNSANNTTQPNNNATTSNNNVAQNNTTNSSTENQVNNNSANNSAQPNNNTTTSNNNVAQNNTTNNSTENPTNNNSTNNTTQPNNTTTANNNVAQNNTTNSSTENSANNNSANNTTQPNNTTTANNNVAQNNTTNSSTENSANNNSANNTTQPNNNATTSNNNVAQNNTTNSSTENSANNNSANNTTQPNNNATTSNNNVAQNNTTNSSTENQVNNNSANNTTQPNNNTTTSNNNVAQNNTTNNSTENPTNNNSTNNTTQPNNTTTANNNVAQNNTTNSSTENSANNNTANNTTQPNNTTTANNNVAQNNPTNNSSENTANNNSTNNATQPNNTSSTNNQSNTQPTVNNQQNVSQTSSLYSTAPTMQSNTTIGVNTVIPTTTVQYSNPAASEANKSAAAFSANAESATGNANATRMQARQTSDPQQAKLLYQKADSLDNVATQEKLQGTEYTNNANVTQYESNQQQLASWQNTLQRNNSDKITTANLLVQDANFYYNKSISEKHKADSNKKSYIKESYLENAKQDIATALLKQQQAENIYLSVDPNVATEAASNTIVAANTQSTPTNTNNVIVNQNTETNTQAQNNNSTTNSNNPANNSNTTTLPNNSENAQTNNSNTSNNLSNNPSNSTSNPSSTNPTDNNTSTANNNQNSQSNPSNNTSNNTSTQSANKIDSMLSSPNNTATTNTPNNNNNPSNSNNTTTLNNSTNSSTENPANNTSTNNSTQPNNNSTVANNTTTNPANNNSTIANNTATNPTNNSTENPANNTSTNNTTQPNNNSTVANNTATNPTNNSTENPANNTSTNNTTQPNNNSTIANNTATNPTNNSTENPANNTSTNSTTQPNNNSTVANNTTTNAANNASTNNSAQPNNNSPQTNQLNNTSASIASANKIDSMLSANNTSNNNSSSTNNPSNNQNTTNNSSQNNNSSISSNNTSNSSNTQSLEASNTVSNTSNTTNNGIAAEDVFVESSTSPYSETKPIPVDPPLPQGLIYKVQIGAFRNPIPQNLFKGINPIAGEKTRSGLTRYLAGIFKEYGGAKNAENKIHQLGYKDAFIVAFLNGKRVPLSQANGTQGNNTPNNAIASNSTQAEHNNTPLNTTQTQAQPSDVTNSAPAAPIKDLKGLFYTVQVGAFQRPVSSSSLYNLKPLFSYNASNGYIRYNCGIYSNLPQANIAKQEIILKTPIKDAFIVVYSNGERIGLGQASQLLNSGAATISTSPLLNVMPNGAKASNNTTPQISPAPNTNSDNTPTNNNTVVAPAVIDTAKPAPSNITQPAIQSNSTSVTAPTNSNPPSLSGWSMTSRSLSSANIDPAGDITVSVTIHRGSITGFAKLEEEIPAGFTATEGEKQNSTFKFENGRASYLWLALPADSIFTVSYKLSALSTATGQQTITGKFLYTSNDERQEAPIAPSIIIVGGNTATTNVPTSVTPTNTGNTTSGTLSVPDTSKNGKVSFCVQVGAYSGNIPVDMANKLLQISNQGIHAHKEDNGITSYTVGEYPTYTSADLLKQELVKAGYTESFIVAYYQGKKISLQQAQALINK